MPGLARFKRKQNERRKRMERRTTCHERFFGDDLLAVLYGVHDGWPLLVFGLSCDADGAAAYAEQLTDATLRMSTTESAMALDAIVDGEVVGRLATSLGNDALPVAAAHLKAQNSKKLRVAVESMWDGPSEPKPIRLKVAYERVSVEEFHGAPTVVGQGSFSATTVDPQTGRVYVHRFATKDAAEAQRKRDIAADMPFAESAA